MNIAILGTGPAAIASAVLLRNNNNIALITRNKSNTKQIHDLTLHTHDKTLYSRAPYYAYNTPEADDFIINKADIILVTLPTHAVYKTLASLADQINQATQKRKIYLGLIYGQGDIQYLLPYQIRKTNLTLFATAFLPWITKRDLTTELIHVKLYGIEHFNLIYTKSEQDFEFIRDNLYKHLSDIDYAYTPYSASVALASDNMLLHPPRLAALFGQRWSRYEDIPTFYRDYGILEQIVFTELEKEIYSLKRHIYEQEIEKLLNPSNKAFLLSYKEFEELNDKAKYGNNTQTKPFDIHTYTHKEHTTASKVPTVYDQKTDTYSIDTNHRYFKDDFEYGLLYVKLMARTYHFNTPMIDKLLSWAEKNISPINKDNPYLSQIIKFQ